MVEDTPCTIEQIEEEFGREVAELVEQLTNVATRADGNRATRVAVNRAHSASASPRAKTVKLADVIHNVSCILECPYDFAVRYVEEKRELIEVLRGGDPRLLQRAREVRSGPPWPVDGSSFPGRACVPVSFVGHRKLTIF